MSGARLKDRPRGARLLAHLPDSAFYGKQTELAFKFGVSESVICSERKIRKLGLVNDCDPTPPTDAERLRKSRARIYELHFIVKKTPEEIAQLLNFSVQDVRVLIGKMRL